MRRLAPGRLVLATHNRGKAEEVAALLAGHGIVLVTAGELGLPVPEETETTFAGNAALKARAAAVATGLPALADDSGLSVDALGGAPGIHTADWAETPSGRDFGRAMARLHADLVRSGRPEPWTARFVCALALAWPDGEDAVHEGHVTGRIVHPGRGSAGHGYDPVFLPDGHDLTFGEMDRWAKNRLSHRGRAMDRLIAAHLG